MNRINNLQAAKYLSGQELFYVVKKWAFDVNDHNEIWVLTNLGRSVTGDLPLFQALKT